MQSQRRLVGFTFWEILLVSLLGMAAIAKWGMHSGQDLGPDLVNYHFYNAYLAFHKERLLTDIFPAGIQGYLNPYLYVLPYWLYKVLPPRGVGLTIGGLHGLCFISTYVIARLLLADWSLRSGRVIAFACAAFGVINPFFLAMIGSTFSDNLTPPLILIPLALVMMVRFPDPADLPSTRKYYLSLALSGLMMGAAVGFKLCNCSFVLGLAVAWLVKFRICKKDIWGGVALFGAVGMGFLMVNGEWMWRLYTEFHSPLFPFYNQIFHSPMIKEIDTNVPAWAAAHSLYDFFVYPYQWVVGIPPKSEWEFTDSRFAILYSLIGAILIFRFLPNAIYHINKKLTGDNRKVMVSKRDNYIVYRWSFIAAWAAISYIFWIDQFGALRYLMPVTLLTGILMLMCVQILVRHRFVTTVLWLVLASVALATMKPAYFGRVRWKQSWYPVHVPEQLLASRDTLYLKNSLSFMIPFFPNDAQYVGLGYLALQGGLIEKGKSIVNNHQGPIRTLLLVPMTDGSFYDDLQKYGMRVDPRDCVSFKGGVYPFLSCSVERITLHQQPITMPLPTTLQFTEAQIPWIKVTKGFYYPEPAGVWTKGVDSEIDLLGVLPRHFKLKITAPYFLGENNRLPINVTIGDQTQEMVFGSGNTAEVVFHLNTANANKIILKIPKP